MWVSVLVLLVLISGARTVSRAAGDDAMTAGISGSNKCPYTHQNKHDTSNTGH